MVDFSRAAPGLACLFTAAALSACAVGPNYREPQLPVPDAWHSQVEPVLTQSVSDGQLPPHCGNVEPQLPVSDWHSQADPVFTHSVDAGQTPPHCGNEEPQPVPGSVVVVVVVVGT